MCSTSILNKDARPSFFLSQAWAVIFAVGGRWLQDVCRRISNRFQLRFASCRDSFSCKSSAARCLRIKASLAALGMAAMIAGVFTLPTPALGQGQTLTITGGNTVTVTITARDMKKPYQKIQGTGVLHKKGESFLRLTGVDNSLAGTIVLEEGGLRIRADGELGADSSVLHFRGGTLQLFSDSMITLQASRLLTISRFGAFDTGLDKTVVVRSSLSGAGKLKKTGLGELDLRDVQASMFTGELEMDAGRVKVDSGSDLGQAWGLLFSGGTLSFALPAPNTTLTITAQISVNSAGGTFDIASTVTAHYRFGRRERIEHSRVAVVQGILAGSGELRKTGFEGLDLRSAKASGFDGTLRIEEGKLHIDDEDDLGSERARLVLAGGGLDLGSAKLTVARPILITESSELGGVDAQINSTISVARKDVTVTITGKVSLGGERNHIGDIYIDTVAGRVGHLVGSMGSLGSGPKRVILGRQEYYYPDEARIDVTEGLMSNWTVRIGYRGEIRKTGAGRLTVSNSKIIQPSNTRWHYLPIFHIEEGTLVDRGGNEAAWFRVNAAATLAFEVDAGAISTLSLSYQINGYGGSLAKTGKGLLDLSAVSSYRGDIDRFILDEGVVSISDEHQLGYPDFRSKRRPAVVFAGGSLRFANAAATVTIVPERLLEVASAGTVDTSVHAVVVHSTLTGSGELSKAGSGALDFRNIQADQFDGTLRIEEGKLHIDEEDDLGSERARLVLAGGGLDLGSAKLTVARPILITENSELGGVNGQINSTISVRNDADLTITGKVSLGGERNHIGDIYIGYTPGRIGHLVGSMGSLGAGPKRVILGRNDYYYYEEARIDVTEGLMSNWTVSIGYRGAIRKTGAGRLTVSNSKIIQPLNIRWYSPSLLRIEEGTLVDRGGNEAGGVSVNAAATLEFDVAESNTLSLSYGIDGEGGSLAKTGKGLLDLSGITFSNIDKFTFHEGTVSISDENQLGIATYRGESIRPTVVFAGGALRFGGSAATMTIGSGRLLTVASSGTLDTTDKVVVVDSTLSGSGLLNKAGSGKLDLRSVQADMFSGTWRIEEGELQIDGQDDLGKADGLVFAGGTLSIEGSSTPITLSKARSVSAATGHKAFFALKNTVAMKKDFIDRFDAKSTIKVDFQQSAAARLTIGLGWKQTLTLNNWIFSGGGNSIIDIGITDDDKRPARRSIVPLTANEAAFRGQGMLNITRRVELHNRKSLLSMRGWTVSIAKEQRFVAYAGIVSESTTTFNHIGPDKLTGYGFMVKRDAGYWDMSATNGKEFYGTVTIRDGVARVGNLNTISMINVEETGTLEGGGEVGSVNVGVGMHGGGVWHQGTSSITLKVMGDYTQSDGTYRVYLGPKFAAVTVKGIASLNRGTLTVTAIASVAMNNTYTLMYASSLTVNTSLVTVTVDEQEKIVPSFSLVHDNTVFTSMAIVSSSTYMGVKYKRKQHPAYHMYVKGRNGKQMAMWLQQIDLRNPEGELANYGLLHITSAKQARRALSSLSGEMHVSASSAMMSAGTLLEDAATSQMRMAFGRQAKANQHSLRTTVPGAGFGLADQANVGGGLGMWVQSLEIDKRYGGSGGISALSYSSRGSLLGFDLPVRDWRGGLFSGTSKSQFAQDAGQSTGTDDSYHAGMYAGRMWGSTALRAGLSYSSHEIRMSRRLHLPGADNQLSTSNYRAHTYALFGQLDRRFELAGAVLEPFVGLSQVRHTTGRFVETGVYGLAISSEEQQAVANMVSAGLGVSGGFRLGSARVQARGLLSWKHDLDGGDAAASQSLGISDRLDVYGAGRESSSLELDAGVDVRLNPDARLGITYSELDVLDAGGRDGQFKAVLEFSM